MFFKRKVNLKMGTVEQGFRVEEPDFLVPFDISQDQLPSHAIGELKAITRDYYTIKCIALNGLQINLGFHFRNQKHPNKLREFEVFFDSYKDLLEMYKVRQSHLVQTFGNPHKTENGTCDSEMKSCYWRFGNISICHYVFDRFGPEEHIQILKE